jgi:hypothetical protein
VPKVLVSETTHNTVEEPHKKTRNRFEEVLPQYAPVFEQYHSLKALIAEQRIEQGAERFIYLGAHTDIFIPRIVDFRWKLVDNYHEDDHHEDEYITVAMELPRQLSKVRAAATREELEDLVERCGSQLVFYREEQKDYAMQIGDWLIDKADYVLTDEELTGRKTVGKTTVVDGMDQLTIPPGTLQLVGDHDRKHHQGELILPVSRQLILYKN